MVALTSIVYPIITRTMLNDLIPNQNYRGIVVFGTVLLGIYTLRMLLNYFIQYEGHMMGVRMQAQMRSDMDELREAQEETRDGVNVLLEWAEACGNVIKFPLPRIK